MFRRKERVLYEVSRMERFLYEVIISDKEESEVRAGKCPGCYKVSGKSCKSSHTVRNPLEASPQWPI